MPGCKPTCVEEKYGAGVDASTLTSGTRTVNYRDETDQPCSLNYDVSQDYVGVYLLPSESDYDLYRRKWNYVKNLYNKGYKLCEDYPDCINAGGQEGDWYDTRAQYTSSAYCDPDNTPNAAYWLDYNKYQEEFYDHLFTWTEYAYNRSSGKYAIFEKWLQWRFEIGSNTGLYSNLPQHKRNDHEGHCWMPCPYDENTSENRMRAMLDLDEGEFPLEGRNDHENHYMETAVRGNIWGFECTSDTCTYYVTYGERYFYS